MTECLHCKPQGWTCKSEGKGKTITFHNEPVPNTAYDKEAIDQCGILIGQGLLSPIWKKLGARWGKTWSTADGTPIFDINQYTGA